MVKLAYDDLLRSAKRSKGKLPKNTGGLDWFRRNLDCAVIRALHLSRKEAGEESFDTVPAAFIEGQPLYVNAGFSRKTHIQVCVRELGNIKGYFRPIDEAGNPITFA